jgi:PAT family beta-lactamase induction signal transducer AmpG
VTRPTAGSAGWRTALILCTYGYQGLFAGFAVNALPNWHAASGTSLAEIGAFLAVMGVPWTAQPLWGPVVDRFGGSRAGARRLWVLAGLAGVLAALGLLFLAADSAPGLGGLGLILLLHNLFAALVDTALDGLLIDRVPADRLGQATALTRVGFAGGTAAGAALFAWAIPALGVPAAALLLLGFGTAATGMALAVREAAEDDLLPFRWRAGPARGTGLGAMLGDLAFQATRREALALIALCVTVEFVIHAFGVRLAVGLVQEGGWEAGDVSRMQGALTLLGGTAGALAVAWWVDRAGPYRALTALLGLAAASHVAAALLLTGGGISGTGQALALGMSALSPALFFVALAPAVMLESRGANAATRFALFMAALNLGSISGAAASAPIGAVLDLPQMGIGAALVLAACTLTVNAAFRAARSGRSA